MSTVYFAKWILQDNDEILNNGAIVVNGDTIADIGPRSRVKRESGDRIVNLGDVLLLPGLINMHTHLEEGAIRGIQKSADETFAAFSAKKSTRVRHSSEDLIRSHIKLGVRELIANGITGVLDSSRLGLSAQVLADEPIRSWVIHEFHAEDSAHDETIADIAKSRLYKCADRVTTGIGPHAIFSLSPRSQKSLIQLTYEWQCPWATHLAESAEELQAFSEQKGDLFFQITRKRTWPYGDTAMGSMHYAITANLVPPGGICFHCNYANGHELALLASKRAPVVHCFQYSQALGHKQFPIDVALNRGVMLCIGTEGINPPGFMSIFDELFWIKSAYPHISAREMLKWVTRNPASALKMSSKLGSLSPGKYADMIGVRVVHDSNQDILEELLIEEPEVLFVMIHGEEIVVNC